MLASQDPSPSPIAKLDTRHINRGPRKDVCEAETPHAQLAIFFGSWVRNLMGWVLHCMGCFSLRCFSRLGPTLVLRFLGWKSRYVPSPMNCVTHDGLFGCYIRILGGMGRVFNVCAAIPSGKGREGKGRGR